MYVYRVNWARKNQCSVCFSSISLQKQPRCTQQNAYFAAGHSGWLEMDNLPLMPTAGRMGHAR